MAETSEGKVLYVGDFDMSVTEKMLKDTFSCMEGYRTAVLCKDNKGRSFSGLVIFDTNDQALRALVLQNLKYLNLISDPNSRENGAELQHDGENLSGKVVVDENSKKTGNAYVIETEESAKDALWRIQHSSTLDGKHIRVTNKGNIEDRNPTLYVKHINQNVIESQLYAHFSRCGKVISAKILRDAEGWSRRYGFVRFATHEEAKAAINLFDGVMFQGSRLKLSFARTKKVENLHEQQQDSEPQQHGNPNVYVANINVNADDNELEEFFSSRGIGTVTSVKIMRNQTGNSKGVGFVCFSTPQDATRVINELNGVVFQGNPLDLSPAKCKEECNTFFQNLRGQRRQPREAPAVYMLPSGYDLDLQLSYFRPVHITRIGDGPEQRIVHQPVHMSGVGPLYELSKNSQGQWNIPRQQQQPVCQPPMGQGYVQQQHQPVYGSLHEQPMFQPMGVGPMGHGFVQQPAYQGVHEQPMFQPVWVSPMGQSYVQQQHQPTYQPVYEQPMFQPVGVDPMGQGYMSQQQQQPVSQFPNWEANIGAQKAFLELLRQPGQPQVKEVGEENVRPSEHGCSTSKQGEAEVEEENSDSQSGSGEASSSNQGGGFGSGQGSSSKGKEKIIDM